LDGGFAECRKQTRLPTGPKEPVTFASIAGNNQNDKNLRLACRAGSGHDGIGKKRL
jgi:hypothetical protein